MTDSPDTIPHSASPSTAASAGMFPLELVILDHYARRSQCLLNSLPATLGRGENDNVRLADPWISHSHCRLVQQGEIVMVCDLDSKNGVFLHGVRVREAEVLPGDCLTLGRTEITFHYQRASTVKNGEAGAPQASPQGVRQLPHVGPTTEELLY